MKMETWRIFVYNGYQVSIKQVLNIQGCLTINHYCTYGEYNHMYVIMMWGPYNDHKLLYQDKQESNDESIARAHGL